MIRILTDSASDILPAEAEQLGVTVIPLNVTLEDGIVLRDGIDMTPSAYYDHLASCRKLPTTSQPSPELFEKFYLEVAAAGDEVLGIFLSHELSGTWQCAKLAADLANVDNVLFVDSANVCLGDALLVRLAVQLRDAGKTLVQIATTLEHAKEHTGLPIVTEIMNPNHLPMFEHVDLIQVGARNMQNFELLKELGKIDKPILLKRGMANTIKEWLMSAEYIMAGGNENIILCERGIRTFETYTRNTLDLSAIPVLKELTHLPVIVDPSHATGVARYVKSMALAAVAAGADGLMIEVHNNPAKALCDGAQSLTPAQFADVMAGVRQIREVMK